MRLFNEKSNVRTCDVWSRHTVLGGSARQDATDRLDNATSVMHEIMGMPDKGIPEEVLEHAKCVAVIPHMVKGGFVFGAKGGKGVATCRTADGWSAPAFITISGGKLGVANRYRGGRRGTDHSE